MEIRKGKEKERNACKPTARKDFKN